MELLVEIDFAANSAGGDGSCGVLLQPYLLEPPSIAILLARST